MNPEPVSVHDPQGLVCTFKFEKQCQLCVDCMPWCLPTHVTMETTTQDSPWSLKLSHSPSLTHVFACYPLEEQFLDLWTVTELVAGAILSNGHFTSILKQSQTIEMYLLTSWNRDYYFSSPSAYWPLSLPFWSEVKKQGEALESQLKLP